MKDKPGQQDKDVPEGPVLKTAGPEGEITAGLVLSQIFFIPISYDICFLFGVDKFISYILTIRSHFPV